MNRKKFLTMINRNSNLIYSHQQGANSICGKVSNEPVPAVWNLGSMLVKHLTMNEHVIRVCSGSYLHLCNIAAICYSLLMQLLHAIVAS